MKNGKMREERFSKNGRDYQVSMDNDGIMKINVNNEGWVNTDVQYTKKSNTWGFDLQCTSLRKLAPKNVSIVVETPIAKSFHDETIEKQYAHLVEKFKVPSFHSTPDEEKYNEIMKKIVSVPHTERENEIQEMMRLSNNEKIEKEATQYCDHEIVVETTYGHTGDSRLSVTRTHRCKNCSLYFSETIEDSSSDESSWR